MRLKHLLVPLLTASLLTSASAAALTAFDNFGPGFSYDPDLAYVVGIDGFGVNTIGVSFTAEETGFFSAFWIAANANITGSDDGLIYSLRADVGGQPAVLLESVTLNEVCYETVCPDGEVRSANASQMTLLTAGDQYWLFATAADPSSGFLWFAAPPGEGPATIMIMNALFPDGAFFEVAQPPVFRIDVVAEQGEISEPLPLSLTALTLFLIFLLRSAIAPGRGSRFHLYARRLLQPTRHSGR